MRPRPLLLALVALLATGPAAAAGKIYKCKNDKGDIYYSQAYDPKHCGGGGAQLNAQGLAVKQIDRIKSPEELAAEKAAAEKAAAEKAIADEKARSDQVLVMSYSTEEDLTRAQNAELSAIDTAIDTTRRQIDMQQKSLAELLASAAEAERGGHEVPPAVAANIGKVRAQIEQQNAFIARKEQEREVAAKEFAAELERYREIKARMAKH
jgi:hypothetical protein